MERTVYVLQDSVGSIYVGATSDLARRLKEHRKGDCYTTRTKYITRSLTCIHNYIVPDFFKADKLERYLHTLDKEELLHLIYEVPIYTAWLENEILSADLPKIPVSLPNKSQMDHFLGESNHV